MTYHILEVQKLDKDGHILSQEFFVVNEEGRVVDVEIIRGISTDCDKEAARVIALMPLWKPGMQNKMAVAVRMILPIKFKLE